MLMELIEKKNQPVKTRYKFTKKEWESLPEKIKNAYKPESDADIHFTARTVYFDVDGDMLNRR